MKKAFRIALIVVALVMVLFGIFAWKTWQSFMIMETLQPDPQLKIVLGGGGNSIILTSEDGKQALVVDTKMGKAAEEFHKMASAAEVTVVNTDLHRDHVGGNALFPKATLIAGAYSREEWGADVKGNRYPDKVVPAGGEIVLSIGTETAHIRNMGRAHTRNDVVVYLQNRKLLVTGDLDFSGRHPVLIARSGCSTGAWNNVIDSLLARYDIRTLVPGHGRVSDKSALLNIREYFVLAGEAVADSGKLAAFRERYRDYGELPGMASSDKTIEFIRNERTGR